MDQDFLGAGSATGTDDDSMEEDDNSTRANLDTSRIDKQAVWPQLQSFQEAYLIGDNGQQLDPFAFQGGHVVPTVLNCFTGILGTQYLQFISTHTTWINDFTNHWMPDSGHYAWLSPYQGNEHNRTLFTQAALHVVLRWQHVYNATCLPNLYEPFIGSGQVFMFADDFADPLLESPTGPLLGLPFGRLIAGDLNRYLIASYRAMQAHDDFVQRYRNFAEVWDDKMTEAMDGAPNPLVYKEVVQHINALGPTITDTPNADVDLNVACCYIWLVNRGVQGAKVNPQGVLVAQLNKTVNLFGVQTREKNTLPRVLRQARRANRSFCLADFALTTSTATAQDIVFMDCPFPTYSVTIPNDDTLISVASGVYGLDTAGDLQQRMLEEAWRLIMQGTTVLLCNYANPDLVLAYSRLLSKCGHQPRKFIYTYKSPTQDTVYQLVLFPGWGNHQQQAPDLIRGVANFLARDATFVPQ